jgi:hypothetical protein
MQAKPCFERYEMYPNLNIVSIKIHLIARIYIKHLSNLKQSDTLRIIKGEKN